MSRECTRVTLRTLFLLFQSLFFSRPRGTLHSGTASGLREFGSVTACRRSIEGVHSSSVVSPPNGVSMQTWTGRCLGAAPRSAPRGPGGIAGPRRSTPPRNKGLCMTATDLRTVRHVPSFGPQNATARGAFAVGETPALPRRPNTAPRPPAAGGHRGGGCGGRAGGGALLLQTGLADGVWGGEKPRPMPSPRSVPRTQGTLVGLSQAPHDPSPCGCTPPHFVTLPGASREVRASCLDVSCEARGLREPSMGIRPLLCDPPPGGGGGAGRPPHPPHIRKISAGNKNEIYQRPEICTGH